MVRIKNIFSNLIYIYIIMRNQVGGSFGSITLTFLLTIILTIIILVAVNKLYNKNLITYLSNLGNNDKGETN